MPISHYPATATTVSNAIANNMSVGEVIGLKITLSAGVFTITHQNGSALSSTNKGYVCMQSVTGGQNVVLEVTSNYTFNDDSHASSSLTNFGFGITESVAWANDMPFFIYAVNKADTNFSGAANVSTFAISRLPGRATSPSSANSIGDTNTVATTDDELAIMLLGDYTLANYTSLPMSLIGCFRMQWSAANTDYTVQTLAVPDGIGQAAIDGTCAKEWTMPLAQNGAATGTHFQANGGTAPAFSTTLYFYQIARNGVCYPRIFLNADGGADGAGAVNAQIALPYTCRTQATGAILIVGACAVSAAGISTAYLVGTGNGNVYWTPYVPPLTAATNANFGPGARYVKTMFQYPVIVP